MLEVTVDYSQIDGVIRAMQQFPEKLKKSLRTAMVYSQREVLKEAKDRVHVITGRLRKSITALTPTENDGGGWTGRVGTNVVYAAMEEFGFHGAQQVRAFTRSSAFGRPTKPYTVHAYSRQINRVGHPYLTTGLAAARDEIIRIHEKAIADLAQETTK